MEYNIYCIKNPQTDEVVYVGKTKHALLLRLEQHLIDCNNLEKYEYLNKLVSNGTPPVIELLEKCSSHKSSELEKKWIRHYSLLNNNLLNIELKISEPLTDELIFIEKVGTKIRQLRIEAGYTSHETFAYENGIDRTQWSKMERGVDMKVSTLEKALKALNITPAEFFKDFN